MQHCSEDVLPIQAELREAAEARDACKEALELAEQGVADLEAAYARESAAGEDRAKEACFHLLLNAPLLGPSILC